MLRINLTKQAINFLKKIPAKHKHQIERKLSQLEKVHTPNDAKLLKEVNGIWRIDSGEYRIIYRVGSEFIFVLLVGKRNDDEVYDKLKCLKLN